jgi:hypothetical protein
MGDSCVAKTPSCPPIYTQSRLGRLNVFSQEFVDELKAMNGGMVH